jgi:PAS domain S-box-containing protein
MDASPMVNAAEILSARVLIVDDQPANIKLLKLILDRAGYSCVASTTDPRQVCDLHREKSYDLILLDLLMPDMYGFQVIEGLKEIEGERDLPVLVISAQPDYKLRAMQAGAKEFIAKPINSAEVLAQVHELLYARLSTRRESDTAVEHVFQERSARLRESEELFRQFATCLPDAAWIREVNGDLIRYINPAWETVTGQRLVAGDRSEKLFAALHPEDLHRVRLETGDLRSGGVDLECRIVRQDATVRRVHVRTFLIRDAKEKIIQVAGIMQDITESTPAVSAVA